MNGCQTSHKPTRIDLGVIAIHPMRDLIQIGADPSNRARERVEPFTIWCGPGARTTHCASYQLARGEAGSGSTLLNSGQFGL